MATLPQNQTLSYTQLIHPVLIAGCLILCVGFAIPLVSSIIPIQTAFNRSLVDSLDNYRSKTQGVQVNILHKNRKDITSIILFGVIAISFGFGVYYLLPLSLVSFDFQLTMNIFIAIFIGMLFALILLSSNLM